MKRILVSVSLLVFLSGMNSVEARGNHKDEGLDQVPSMSGKIEIMEELGLIEHPSPFQQAAAKKKESPAKKAAHKKVRMNHLADISVDSDK